MFKEAGLRSPRTQLTKVKIEISVRGRRTEATGPPPAGGDEPLPHPPPFGVSRLTEAFGFKPWCSSSFNPCSRAKKVGHPWGMFYYVAIYWCPSVRGLTIRNPPPHPHPPPECRANYWCAWLPTLQYRLSAQSIWILNRASSLFFYTHTQLF